MAASNITSCSASLEATGEENLSTQARRAALPLTSPGGGRIQGEQANRGGRGQTTQQDTRISSKRGGSSLNPSPPRLLCQVISVHRPRTAPGIFSGPRLRPSPHRKNLSLTNPCRTRRTAVGVACTRRTSRSAGHICILITKGRES